MFWIEPQLICESHIYILKLHFITEQKQKAIQHLVALWNTKRKLTQDTLQTKIHQISTDVADTAPVSKIELLLRQKEIESQESRAIEDVPILNEIKKFGLVKRSALCERTIDFWAQNKTTFKEVYELAKIVHAVPVTQVTVERAFSSLAFILTALRNSLHADTLENILLIRLNKEIFEKIPLF